MPSGFVTSLSTHSPGVVRPFDWCSGLLFFFLPLGLACGSGGGSPMITTAPPEPPTITTQPANQTTRVGQTATFTVAASGTAPLSYQWSRNGAAISGAVSASYTTPAAAPADNGTTFIVKVTNSVGSVTSKAASLTVGPRAPKAGDLRFQQVAAASTLPGLQGGGIHSDVSASLGQGFTNSIGTPLTIGADCGSGTANPYSCGWAFSSFPLPAGVSGLSIDYQGFGSDTSSNTFPDAQLESLVNGHNVFTSLDLELANYAFAASWIQSSSMGGFSYARQVVDPTQLQAVATQLGEQSNVITAISYDASGNVYFIYYSWANDMTTVYDVKVSTATPDTLATEATSLATSGYIITAFGGNLTKGYLLVGTRVHGDNMPRPLLIVTPKTGTDLDPLLASGDAVVGYTLNADFSNTYIGEQ